ncbi:MAG: hypothetical protein ABIG96_03885 [Candidatus Micrarchaeota archaeon]
MEMQVLEEKANDVLGRREIIVKIPVESTPSRKDVMKALQAHFTAAEEQIVIDKIEQPFGTKSVKVFAKIYGKAEDAKNEPAYKGKRGVEEKKASAEEKK